MGIASHVEKKSSLGTAVPQVRTISAVDFCGHLFVLLKSYMYPHVFSRLIMV